MNLPRILNNLSTKVNMLHFDEAYVIRNKEVTDPMTHITGFEDEKLPAFKCRLSDGAPKYNQQQPQHNITSEPVLYCSIDVDIIAGDKVIVTRQSDGGVFEYIVAQPMPTYNSHKRINLKKVDQKA